MDLIELNNLIKDANDTYPDSPILAQVCVTQAIVESALLRDDGGSKLARVHNNLFGIKGEGTGDPPFVMYNTHEYENGRMVVVQDKFASNATYEDSFKQHKAFLEHPRYQSVREAKSVPEAFQELHNDGYATDPNYADTLIEVWHKYVEPNYKPNPPPAGVSTLTIKEELDKIKSSVKESEEAIMHKIRHKDAPRVDEPVLGDTDDDSDDDSDDEEGEEGRDHK